MKIEEIEELAIQMERDDKSRNDLYQKINDAVNCVFTVDENIGKLPFIAGRKFALTDIADARNAGVRTFTSLLPDISVSPSNDNEGEYERVEKLETALSWEVQKMNMPFNGDRKSVV